MASATTKPKKEETVLMMFHETNAGPEGVHTPGDMHEVPESKARALAFDKVASYVDRDLQDQFDEENRHATRVNAKRQEAGLKRLPLSHPALRPGAENAMARFGHPAGTDPRFQGLTWQQVQQQADMMRAAAESEATGPADPIIDEVDPIDSSEDIDPTKIAPVGSIPSDPAKGKGKAK